MEFRESFISAYHNYLINQMLTPGFLLGGPDPGDDFWLLADVLLPGEKGPYLSGRFYDPEGNFLLYMQGGEVVDNPGHCLLRKSGDDFLVLYPSEDMLLAAHTELFANGSLTRIQGKLYDKTGSLRMEPSFESARLFGEVQWIRNGSLRSPDNVISR